MTKNDFEALLNRKPDDWLLRMAYADWLEENGESEEDQQLATAQRWMGENEKCPWLNKYGRSRVYADIDYSYDWWSIARWLGQDDNIPVTCHLSESLIDCFKEQHALEKYSESLEDFREGRDRQHAEKLLADALVKYLRKEK